MSPRFLPNQIIPASVTESWPAKCTAISDADWESGGGHYRLRIEGEWVEVPDETAITQSTRVGRTMVWPIRGYLGLTIRCFMPGSMSSMSSMT